MPEFYHDLITEKSFKVLQDLKKKFKFILIGGWAVFLYTKTIKSKDIDIVLEYDELEKFRQEFNLFKNERLKKYEIKIEEIDVDIYVPYFSNLGFPIEDLTKYCQSIEGFLVPIPEILLIFKSFALKQRKGKTKGRKDIIDIFSLIKEEKINWKTYQEIIKKYNLEKQNQELKDLISSQSAIPELDLSEHKISRLKKKTLEKL